MVHVLRALSLLTVIPVRAHWEADAELGRCMAAFPLVGALIGGVTVGVAWLLGLMPAAGRASLLAAALVLVVGEGITGFLHLDGWADCCDALLPPLERERRHAVLKDPRLGTFGVAGVALLLGVKVAAIATLLGAVAGPLGLLPLLVAPVLGRFAAVAGAALLPLANERGMAASFRRGLGAREVVLAAITTGAGVFLLGWKGAVCAALSALAALAVGLLAQRRLGGATGDVYGALVEVTEAATLTAAAFLSG